jgi:hypothetical protein
MLRKELKEKQKRIKKKRKQKDKIPITILSICSRNKPLTINKR